MKVCIYLFIFIQYCYAIANVNQLLSWKTFDSNKKKEPKQRNPFSFDAIKPESQQMNLLSNLQSFRFRKKDQQNINEISEIQSDIDKHAQMLNFKQVPALPQDFSEHIIYDASKKSINSEDLEGDNVEILQKYFETKQKQIQEEQHPTEIFPNHEQNDYVGHIETLKNNVEFNGFAPQNHENITALKPIIKAIHDHFDRQDYIDNQKLIYEENIKGKDQVESQITTDEFNEQNMIDQNEFPKLVLEHIKVVKINPSLIKKAKLENFNPYSTRFKFAHIHDLEQRKIEEEKAKDYHICKGKPAKRFIKNLHKNLTIDYKSEVEESYNFFSKIDAEGKNRPISFKQLKQGIKESKWSYPGKLDDFAWMLFTKFDLDDNERLDYYEFSMLISETLQEDCKSNVKEPCKNCLSKTVKALEKFFIRPECNPAAPGQITAEELYQRVYNPDPSVTRDTNESNEFVLNTQYYLQNQFTGALYQGQWIRGALRGFYEQYILNTVVLTDDSNYKHKNIKLFFK